MTTLIATETTAGKRRRCDASCYDATGPRCTCICGGRNHGVGQARAIDNARLDQHEILRQIRHANEVDDNGDSAITITFPDLDLQQHRLFRDDE